jgi:hypothetical protein
MFGTMLEAALRSFTDIDGTLRPVIKHDGSMHTFQKQHHPLHIGDIAETTKSTAVTTPIYPFAQAKLPQILEEYTQLPSWQHDHKILVHASDRRWAEINMLFQYHKIAVGIGLGMNIFGGNAEQVACRWNPNYQSLNDMRVWEMREWLSLFYPAWITEWIESPQYVGSDFMILTNQQVLEHTRDCLATVADFCDLTLSGDINQFAVQYQQAQQYVLDEYSQIESILYHVLHDMPRTWQQPLSIIGEAILQQQFRAMGWEWQCDGLDELPMDSVKLSAIIYQPDKDPHA